MLGAAVLGLATPAPPGAAAAEEAPAALSRSLQGATPTVEGPLDGMEQPGVASGSGHLEHALRAVPAEWRPRVEAWMTRATRVPRRRIALGGIAGLLVLAFLLRACRKGDLAVVIEYPAEIRGAFSVVLSRSKPAPKETRRRRSRRNRTSSRTQHHMVARETQFRGLPSRRYWVNVTGVLEDPRTRKVLRDISETRSVDVGVGVTARVELDFHPYGCPIEVRILWERQLVREASVCVLGRPDCLRYARNGIVHLELRQGTHRLAIGSGDRVAEIEIDVQDFQPISHTVDLGHTDDIVFKGCPPAVGPYLLGDLAGAARALASEGQEELSHVLQARLYEARDRTDRAAEHLEAAGCHQRAAELWASRSDFARAASLFEAAGDHLRAAEMYRSAGDLAKAGQAFEEAADLENAVRCYREGSENERLMDALERCGDSFGAARVAQDHDDRARTIRLLQQVGPEDSRYTDACMMLVDAYEHEGHHDLAAERLEAGIAALARDRRTPDLYAQLADLLERADDPARALEVLEQLRSIQPTHPDLGSRIEAVRKRLSLERRGSPHSDTPGTRYEILEQVGRGGMGIVFKAHDRRLGRVVALKKLPENLRDHPTVAQLFLREARAAAALNHPNIVTLFDADQDCGTFFITMEFLEGASLQTVLRQHRRLSDRDCARLGLQIAAGLQYAHSQRIVHRDIKPANLFFTRDRVVKIMDFGLAKTIEEVRRASTVLGGTPFYMAPEQAGGESVDARADLYSFGVTLFELATGGVPFRDGDVTYHHRHTPAPDPRERVPDLGDAFADLVLQLLEKDPDARCASAEEVGGRLEAIARS